MVKGAPRQGFTGLLLGAVDRLRAAGGKFWADVLVVGLVAALTTARHVASPEFIAACLQAGSEPIPLQWPRF